MNMTIVIVSKRSVDLVLLLAICSLGLLQISPQQQNGVLCETEPTAAEQEIPATVQALATENKALDEQMLESITRDLGKHFSDTMSSEMEHLLKDISDETKESRRQLRETSKKPHSSGAKLDESKLSELKNANQAASEDIRARIELVGDNSGKLPQMNLGGAANSLLSVASNRLASAGSFIGSRMRALSSSLGSKVPQKLKKFFRWPSFFNFKVRFHKRYSSLREELYRNFVFLKNQIVVNMQHIRFLARRDSFVLGQTQYSDMTETEYREAVGNKEAANDKLTAETSKDEHSKLLANMEALAAAKKTVYGEALPSSSSAKKANRKKRSTPIVADDDDDELNDSEDDDVLDEAAFGLGKAADSGNASDDEEYDDDLEAYKLVDEFAGDFDLNNLDDTLNDLDAALEPTHFEPIDLRSTGCLITPENQENCGCCYAHVVTALASYHECMGMEQKKPRRYHARFVSDCGRYIAPPELGPMWVKGCSGGRPTKALEFVQVVGIPLFLYYQFAQVSAGLFKPLPQPEPTEQELIAQNQIGNDLFPAESKPVAPKQRLPRDECAYPRPSDLANHAEWPVNLVQFDFLKTARIIKLNITEVNLHLRTVGPVLVSVRMWPNFEKYEAGVYDKCEEPVNGRVDLHSMMVVGHDYDSQGREIFIVWNSHGKVWGEQGYLKITAEAMDCYAIMFLGTPPDIQE